MQNLSSFVAPNGMKLHLDPASLTGTVFYPADNAMQLYNKQGQLVLVQCPQGRADMETFVAQLTAAGAPLLPLADDKCLVYAAPQAVCFATTNTHGDVLVGIQGVDWFEAKDGKAWQTLFAAVRQTGNTVLSYTPEVAHARFSSPAALHIVPAHIVRMNGDGSYDQLNVNFDNCASLDVQTGGTHKHRAELQHALLNKFWRERSDEFPTPNAADAAAKKEVDRLTLAARRAFASELAAQAGSRLTEIQNDQRPIYVQLQDFSHVLTFDAEKVGDKYHLSLRNKDSSGSYRETLTAYFNSAAERDASLDALKHMLTKKSTPVPKGPSR